MRAWMKICDLALCMADRMADRKQDVEHQDIRVEFLAWGDPVRGESAPARTSTLNVPQKTLTLEDHVQGEEQEVVGIGTR